ncbi:MAG: glycosyltransferase family 4 protein [Deltaproteobacteria bacterium]|nr:glycosyltransferase family 4 protein [Deltaproteobacteria bacterium]
MTNIDNRPLRICLLGYRSNPHCGGQGVYIRNLSHALIRLGHFVEVVSGPQYPELTNGIPLVKLPSLDLYNPKDLFRTPRPKELNDGINLLEWLGVSSMGFPEPYTFGLRAWRFLKSRDFQYDVIHDNQSLSYGIWAIGRRFPLVATIHHPITVDRDLAVRSEKAIWRKLSALRWHSFLSMQKRVSRTLSNIITVSQCSKADISHEFDIPKNRFTVIPNGINTDLFHPVYGVQRAKNRIIVTNSADIPLKGLQHLLPAVANILKKRPVSLIVVGSPKKNGQISKLIKRLGIGRHITFTGRISDAEFVRQYARATIAVVPSVYEGFGLPAGEAMACGVPVISTTGGALPEVVGDAGILVPPADSRALETAILHLLDNPDQAKELGEAGRRRVEKHLTWSAAAKKTVEVYKRAIRDHHRP